MANEKNKLDQFFKEKLENHTKKPSALAWERLESQLPQKSKSYKGIWWAAAASLTILFTVGYLMLREGNVLIEQPMLADSSIEEAIVNSKKTETINITETEEAAIEKENQQAAKAPKTNPTSIKPANPSKTQKIQSSTPQNLVAINEVKKEPIKEESVKISTTTLEIETPEIAKLELPGLELEKAVAQVVKPAEEEQPTYTVKIYSNGLKEEPKDKNLIAGIGKTVNEVGGIIEKVDQGFADLQDAKNNLFASITSKKPRAED